MKASGASANAGEEMAPKAKNPCKSDLQGFLRFGGVDGTVLTFCKNCLKSMTYKKPSLNFGTQNSTGFGTYEV